MVKPTYSEGGSPLDKWRRQKDKVLEADSVVSEEPTADTTADTTGGFKSPPAIPRASSAIRGSSGDLNYVPIQAPPPKGEPTMVPIRAPPPKGEPTMVPGQRRRRSAEATMVPIQTPPPKGEPTMIPGQRRRPSAEPTMVPIQAPPPKGEATMVPGQSRRRSAEATMAPIQAPPPKGEATMIPGQRRRPSAEPTMVPIQAPLPMGEVTMARFDRSQERDSRAIPEAAVNNFIDELRSIASAQGMDFSIIQPDGMKFDFFTDSKALRVTFTGRELAIDRIVVREISPSANTREQNVGGNEARSLLGAGSARRRMLEWESGGSDAGKRNAKLDVATIRDPNSGALDWNEPHALEEIKTAVPASRIAMEAHYFDADDGRNLLIELVDSTPAPVDVTGNRAPERELTPEGAKRLIMLLLNCLRSITEHNTKDQR